MKSKAFTFIYFLIFQTTAFAEIKSGLCSPYYASIKSNKVNAHVGPGINYKITCEYIMKGVPVIITAKYDHWRRIRDPDGMVCWVHKSMLSPKRFVITISENLSNLRENTNDSSKIIAKIKKNVVMRLISVRGNWCKVEIDYGNKTYNGWVKKDSIFGVFNNEIW
ncbi:MAG: SH3 domain-containing protein [Holosporales bacterium]|nr:SH3 domain-containing protein [Holosporales bacterium]